MDSLSNSSTIDSALPPRILFVTLGCAKNEVDTDRMRALLLSSGFVETKDANDCDVVIINTCSFLASATSESIDVTLDLADGVAAGVRARPIVMCGCVPSRYGGDLPDQLPEVAAFVRADEEDNIVDVVSRVLGMGEAPDAATSADGALRTVEGASAYVKISDGCDRYCAFCAIPYIRGRYFSRPEDEILSEVRELMEGGVREIVLIGQDTGVWGHDLGDGRTLAWLLRRVAEEVRPFGGWVRVLYLQPEGMTDELVEVIRDTPEVLKYIDMPIQHCNGEILRAMNRSGSVDEIRAVFDRLRREIPGMVLRTTGLVGFPGETDEQFEELLDFVREQEFDYTSVFAYSREDGTAAAKMGSQVPEDVKLDRAQQLLDVAEEMGFAATSRHVGECVDVIVDGVEETESGVELVGHAWFQAPDSDGAVHIAEGEASVGDVVRVNLVDSFCYELVGEIVEEEG
ncbi:MAG: 30S ribosomal protein S12 methylthiotransferase RimO [Olsenella sp.]|nr:30S ribosomal protein S12 methylthiotransferase RimO [Olsenella sp.]